MGHLPPLATSASNVENCIDYPPPADRLSTEPVPFWQKSFDNSPLLLREIAGILTINSHAAAPPSLDVKTKGGVVAIFLKSRYRDTCVLR